MRIRTIKPEFWQNERLAALPEFTRLLAIGLLNLADDEGYFNANASLVKAAIFPFLDESRNIPRALQELSNLGYIRLLDGTDGRSYGVVVKFREHQWITKAKPSKIKPLCLGLDESETLPGLGTDTSTEEQGSGKGTGNRDQGRNTGAANAAPGVSAQEPTPDQEPKTKRFVKPTPAEVEAYANEIGYPMDGQAWCDTYEQKGWKVGKAPMKDWKAAVRTWKANGWAPTGGGGGRERRAGWL